MSDIYHLLGSKESIIKKYPWGRNNARAEKIIYRMMDDFILNDLFIVSEHDRYYMYSSKQTF